jgi:MoaA/NifB/PqqE/SkfB family radical SAM enzyme
MCPRQHIKLDESYMSRELFQKLLDEIEEESFQAVVLPFWRGESCIHPEFLQLMDHVLSRGFRVHLSTNGHFMSREHMEIFYRCEFLTLSLHTGKGYQNARKLAGNKPAWSQATIQVSFVRSERSTARLLRQCIHDPHLQGFDAVRLYEDHSLDGEFGRSVKPALEKRRFCPKLQHTFVISADGEYSRCNHIWETASSLNLNHRSIRQVWESQEMQRIRDEYPDEICFPCDQWSGHTAGEVWRKDEQGSVLHQKFGAF